jgi:TonB family protein
MAQRPTVRTDASEHRGRNGDLLADRATEPRNGQPLDALSIRVSGDGTVPSPSDPALEQVLTLITEQACLATSATASAIAVKEHDQIICRATTGPNAPDLGMPLDTTSGLSGACVRSREAQYCEDTETDSRVNAEACRRLEVRSVMVVPLLREQELVGVFEIFSPLPQAFTRHDLENLNSLSQALLDALYPPKGLADIDPPATSFDFNSPFAGEEASDARLASDHRLADQSMESVISREKAPATELTLPTLIDVPLDYRESCLPVELPAFDATVLPEPADFRDPQVENPVPGVATLVPPPGASAAQSELKTSPTIAPPPEEISRLREWTSAFLTVVVVTLALLLGWMLGRVGWEHAMGGAKNQSRAGSSSSNQSNTSQPRTQTSTAAEDADPILVEPAERGAPANAPDVPGLSENGISTTRRTPFQPKSGTGTAASGGLVVYEDGKIIFRQISPAIDSALKAQAPVAVSSQVAGAHLMRRVEPVYPEPARQRFIEGEVTLEAVIGQDGSVEVLKLLSGDPELASSAADAVRQWHFRPYEQQGKAVPFSTRLSVNFRLH